MGDDGRLLEWRVKQLEQVELALREEIHELRERTRVAPDLMLKALREDYYTKAEARNVFVTRKDHDATSERHRQWPVIVAGLVVSTVTVVNFILGFTGHG